MKWIGFVALGLVGLLVIVAVVLLALGRRADAGRLVAAIEVNRRPTEVWPWITEPDKLKGWVTWLVEVRPLTDGPVHPGSRVEWVMQDANSGNRPMVITSETLAFEVGRRLELKLSSPGAFTGVATYALIDLGGGRTRLATDARYRYDSAFARLMEPLITPAAAKKFDGDLRRLKALAEAAPRAEHSAAEAHAQ